MLTLNSSKKINLFEQVLVKNVDFNKKIQKLKNVCILLTFIFLSITLGLFFVQKNLNSQELALNLQNSSYVANAAKNLERFAMRSAIAKRVDVYKKNLITDVAVYQKFVDFQDFLVEQKINATLKSINVLDKKNFSVTLTFKNNTELLSFIKLSESGEFADKFSNFGVSSFKLSTPKDLKEDQTNELTISGNYL